MVWECNEETCHLTALWQVSINYQPRWALTMEPIHTYFSLVICGLHKEYVTLDDIEITGLDASIVQATQVRSISDFIKTVQFVDISDGFWFDPGHPNPMKKRVKMPKENPYGK